jgi:hypothetical protein
LGEISGNARVTRGRNAVGPAAIPQRILHPDAPLGWLPVDGIEVVQVHDLGAMNVECTFCGALHWMDEKLAVCSVIPASYLDIY